MLIFKDSFAATMYQKKYIVIVKLSNYIGLNSINSKEDGTYIFNSVESDFACGRGVRFELLRFSHNALKPNVALCVIRKEIEGMI